MLCSSNSFQIVFEGYSHLNINNENNMKLIFFSLLVLNLLAFALKMLSLRYGSFFKKLSLFFTITSNMLNFFIIGSSFYILNLFYKDDFDNIYLIHSFGLISLVYKPSFETFLNYFKKISPDNFDALMKDTPILLIKEKYEQASESLITIKESLITDYSLKNSPYIKEIIIKQNILEEKIHTLELNQNPPILTVIEKAGSFDFYSFYLIIKLFFFIIVALSLFCFFKDFNLFKFINPFGLIDNRSIATETKFNAKKISEVGTEILKLHGNLSEKVIILNQKLSIIKTANINLEDLVLKNKLKSDGMLTLTNEKLNLLTNGIKTHGEMLAKISEILSK